MGARLLNHLSRPNVRQFGVQIQGEAVVQGEHTLYLIVDAVDEGRLREFMQPFQMAGSLDIYPASTCVRDVAERRLRGAAAAERADVPTLDPEEACQQAIDAGMVVHRAHPLNCETSIGALVGGVVMPNARFYMRNNFRMPDLDGGGLPAGDRRPGRAAAEPRGARPPEHAIADAGRHAGVRRQRTHAVRPADRRREVESGRRQHRGVDRRAAGRDPRPGRRAGPSATEVLFRGADGGAVDGRPESIRFERSLRLDDARDSDVLLAYAMNGEPLPVEHGYPLRLVVPSWYAVASVKWLTEIELIDRAFSGHYQGDKYWYEWERDGRIVSEPVTVQRVRALITEPSAQSDVRPGELAIRGVAWSGAAPIARVEVSVDGGDWQEARLVSERNRHSWQWWELITRVEKPGDLVLRARATDLAGRTQPERAEWNRLGYGNNAIQEVPVRVA